MNRTSASDLAPQLSQETRHSLAELGNDFLREFLEVEISRHPDNLEALAELGQIYTQLGLWELGLEVDRRLVALVPDNPTAYYNLGCSQALLGQKDAALESLERAVDIGYDDPEFMMTDDDLASLHGDDRFRALVERIRSIS
jgi:tetratricopeptide (TPR) repeat protein